MCIPFCIHLEVMGHTEPDMPIPTPNIIVQNYSRYLQETVHNTIIHVHVARDHTYRVLFIVHYACFNVCVQRVIVEVSVCALHN